MSISLDNVTIGAEVGVGLGSLCTSGAYVKCVTIYKQKSITIHSGKYFSLCGMETSTSSLTISGRSSGLVWTSSVTSSWKLSVSRWQTLSRVSSGLRCRALFVRDKKIRSVRVTSWIKMISLTLIVNLEI